MKHIGAPSGHNWLRREFFSSIHTVFIIIMMLVLFSEEDRYDSYSRMLLKYFLSEGVVCGHEIFIGSAQDHPDDFLQVWQDGG